CLVPPPACLPACADVCFGVWVRTLSAVTQIKAQWTEGCDWNQRRVYATRTAPRLVSRIWAAVARICTQQHNQHTLTHTPTHTHTHTYIDIHSHIHAHTHIHIFYGKLFPLFPSSWVCV